MFWHFLLLIAVTNLKVIKQFQPILQIDSVSLDTNYYEQGSNFKAITDAWVYVDDGLIGAFELPATIPVLAEGKHKLEIRPGIKLNGISSTRAPYPFYQPITYNDFNFFPRVL